MLPLLRDGECIGVLALVRSRAGAFTDAEIALAESFADQAVIAIQNVRLFNETKEALEQQTPRPRSCGSSAARSPTPQPVFEKIIQSCQELFAGHNVGLMLVRDDGLLDVGAYVGPASRRDRPPLSAARRPRQRVRDRDRRAARRRLSGHRAMPRFRPRPDVGGGAQGCEVDDLRADACRRRNPSACYGSAAPRKAAFADKATALLRTFAEPGGDRHQNARLFNETKEALEQQTATAEVLQVISSSVADTAPVFDKILESGQHLFATEQLGIFLVKDDGQVHAERVARVRARRHRKHVSQARSDRR